MDKLSPDENSIARRWQEILGRLEDQLNTIQKEESNVLNWAHKSLRASSTVLQELLSSIAGHAFTPSEEVYFYKEVKPFALSRLFYYSRLYDLEMDRPLSATQGIAAYYTRELQRIAGTFEQHRFIYRYLRSGATYLDEKLFFHPRTPVVIALFGMEPVESASPVCYDHVVSQLRAAELLQKFLTEALDDRQQGSSSPSNLPRVTWTDTKAALIELAYALQSAGVFNNGKIDLKDVIEHLQNAFHINLGNYPRTFQEIIVRKTGYTNFIDRLKNKLLLRIQHIEDKYDRGK